MNGLPTVVDFPSGTLVSSPQAMLTGWFGVGKNLPNPEDRRLIPFSLGRLADSRRFPSGTLVSSHRQC